MPITDPVSARVLVYNVVVSWVANKTGLTADQVDVTRTFVDNPATGYGFSQGEYLQMCDEITPPITTASGRALNLSGTWRLSNQQDQIAVFINGVAVLLIAAPLTPAGVSAHSWAMGV